MLERPDVQDESIAACLRQAYGLAVAQIEFLPLGADVNTAVFRVSANGERPYFLKLRAGVFHETSTTLPKFLFDHGVAEIIPPLPNQKGRLWSSLAGYNVILYPFIKGQDGYAVNLSEPQWRRFGAALRQIHSIVAPARLLNGLPRETFSPRWRNDVRAYLTLVKERRFTEPVAARLAEFLNSKRAETLELVERAERAGETLRGRSPQLTLCHSDLHAGNFLICDEDEFYLVDWDAPLLAPKERDLMYVGAGLAGDWRTPEEEETLFYAGYGQTEIDPIALTYYRCERVVQDIAAYCEQLLLTDAGGADRALSLGYLMANYQPGSVVELASKPDPLSRPSIPRDQ